MKRHWMFCSHENKVGYCLQHNWACPDCGFCVGSQPLCACKPTPAEEEEPEPLFGVHIREAIAIIKPWLKSKNKP